MERINKINKILYIDDEMLNGLSAMSVDSRINYASSLSSVEGNLRDYDCILTDMNMEHSNSGLEVVKRGINAGNLPFIITGGKYTHGGTFDKVDLFGLYLKKTFSKMSKREDAFWNNLIPFVEKIYREKPNGAIQRSFERYYKQFGKVSEEIFNDILRGYEYALNGGQGCEYD